MHIRAVREQYRSYPSLAAIDRAPEGRVPKTITGVDAGSAVQQRRGELIELARNLAGNRKSRATRPVTDAAFGALQEMTGRK